LFRGKRGNVPATHDNSLRPEFGRQMKRVTQIRPDPCDLRLAWPPCPKKTLHLGAKRNKAALRAPPLPGLIGTSNSGAVFLKYLPCTYNPDHPAPPPRKGRPGRCANFTLPLPDHINVYPWAVFWKKRLPPNRLIMARPLSRCTGVSSPAWSLFDL